MFWVGLLIALVAGLVSLELSRKTVRQRYPAIKEYHLDLGALALLVLGLVISAFEQIESQRQIASLESQLRQVRSFEAIIRVRTATSWAGDTPPDLTSVVVDESRPIGLLDLQTHDGVRKLELVPTAAPKITPVETNVVELTLHTRAKPGDWVFDHQIPQLIGVRRIEFGAWGLTRSVTRDGRMQVLAINLRIFVNGTLVANIQKESPTWIELPAGLNRYGSLSWEEYYPFKSGA